MKMSNTSAVGPEDNDLRVALDAALTEVGGKTYWNDKLAVLVVAVRDFTTEARGEAEAATRQRDEAIDALGWLLVAAEDVTDDGGRWDDASRNARDVLEAARALVGSENRPPDDALSILRRGSEVDYSGHGRWSVVCGGITHDEAERIAAFLGIPADDGEYVAAIATEADE